MKVYISADLEGIAGVVSKEQLGGENYNYKRARELMTEEVNAAAKGAFDSGATEVVVNDSHGPMTNILIENIHRDVQLISGTPKPNSMMAGISEEFDLAFLIGYHSRKNCPGVLSHTYSSGTVASLKVNNTEVGELGMNAIFAGYYDVPIGLVSGDNEVCKEGQDILDQGTKFVQVKETMSHTAAKSLHPQKARDLIHEQAKETVLNQANLKPLIKSTPITVTVTFLDRGMAEAASELPGAKLDQGSTVKFSHEDLIEAFKGFRVMIKLAHSVKS